MIIFQKVRWKNFLSTGNSFTEIDFQRSSNTLIVGGKHSIIPGFIDKTLKCFKAVNILFTYNFIIRTNTTCFWVLNKLEQFLHNIHH
jgi:hypothetical protein